MPAAAPARRVWPAHPALSRPLTLCGIERTLFVLVALGGHLTWKLASPAVGATLFCGLYAAAWLANRRDPDLIRVVRANIDAPRRYDPGLPPAARRRVRRARG